MAKTFIETKDIAGLTKKEVAEKLSATLWNLQRPDSVKNPRDVTRYLFGVRPHPIKVDDWVVEADDDFIIRKHTQADATEVLTMVDGLSQVHKTALADYINNNSQPTVSNILTSMRDEIVSYPVWGDLDLGHSFSIDDKVALSEQSEDEEVLVFYKCIQAHSKQSNWIPTSTPALWSEITLVGDIEQWSQPIGGDGRYPYLDPNTGQPYRVLHNGKTWENTVTHTLNVWQPGVFGWIEVA